MEACRPCAFATADFRGFDEETFRFLLPSRDLAAQNAEPVGALGRLGVVTSHIYVKDQSVTAPGFSEACGCSCRPPAIYINGIVGALCNFEAGPSTLAVFFTDREPYYGFHLDEK